MGIEDVTFVRGEVFDEGRIGVARSEDGEDSDVEWEGVWVEDGGGGGTRDDRRCGAHDVVEGFEIGDEGGDTLGNALVELVHHKDVCSVAGLFKPDERVDIEELKDGSV